MKRRLHISRSPKKNPKESRWVSANDVLKSDSYDDSSGISSHYSLMLDGLCCQFPRHREEWKGGIMMEWITAIEDLPDG